MKVITEAVSENEVLASVGKEADGRTIIEGMISRSESCVNHLCGCA